MRSAVQETWVDQIRSVALGAFVNFLSGFELLGSLSSL